MMFPHLPLITAIAAAGYLILLSYGIYRTMKERKKARKELESLREMYFTASAGTPNIGVPVKEESIPIKYTQFRNCKGKVINPYDYKHFIVKGDSMQFCGIKNNDLIFVKKDFKIEDLCSFPTPIVLHRDHAPSNETQYKVRRAWGVCEIGQCTELVIRIIESKEFIEKIATNSYFDGDKAILEDFYDERLRVYLDKYINCDYPSEDNNKVVVSTTFHTDTKKIRFSLHPVSNIVGIVSNSFPVE